MRARAFHISSSSRHRSRHRLVVAERSRLPDASLPPLSPLDGIPPDPRTSANARSCSPALVASHLRAALDDSLPLPSLRSDPPGKVTRPGSDPENSPLFQGFRVGRRLLSMADEYSPGPALRLSLL
jgi:hypothetical protein